MFAGGRTGLLVVLATAITLSLSTPASAAQYHIQAESVADFYQLLTSDNEILNRRRIHQFVGFGAYDLTGDGETQLAINTLLRFSADFGLLEREVDAEQNLHQAQLTIQYATLEGRDLWGVVDFVAGRQLFADASDYLMIDGLLLRLKSPWYIGIELLAGTEAMNYLDSEVPLTASQYELDGTRFVEAYNADDPPTQRMDSPKLVLGAALVTTDLWNTRARLAYRRIMSGFQAGAPLGKVRQEKVSAALYQNIENTVHINLSGSFDLYKLEPDAVRALVRGIVTSAWTVEAEYVRLVPSFDAESIFNIFSVYPLNDINMRVRWAYDRQSAIYAGGMLRLYQNDDASLYTSSEGEARVDSLVQAHGAMAGYRRGFGYWGYVGGELSYEGGYGGMRMLGDIYGRAAVLPEIIELDARVTTLYVQDELQENLDFFSFGYQLGARYLIDDIAGVQLMFEHNMNRLQETQIRVFLVADLNVWL